ncbi:MAG: hypothetical protein HQL25_06690 [Candidatus Omnitrophica bacterium]|nr:hypothetical protein [Candidatus Omnitrophota bacterium]
MVKSVIRSVNVLISFTIIFYLAGCGTVLYPEHKGQQVSAADKAQDKGEGQVKTKF